MVEAEFNMNSKPLVWRYVVAGWIGLWLMVLIVALVRYQFDPVITACLMALPAILCLFFIPLFVFWDKAAAKSGSGSRPDGSAETDRNPRKRRYLAGGWIFVGLMIFNLVLGRYGIENVLAVFYMAMPFLMFIIVIPVVLV